MWSQNRDDCGLKRLVLWVAIITSIERVEGSFQPIIASLEQTLSVLTYCIDALNPTYGPSLVQDMSISRSNAIDCQSNLGICKMEYRILR